MRQHSLDGGVEPFRVDSLHELEALRGRLFDGRPPNGARVVDKDVEAAVYLAYEKQSEKNLGINATEGLPRRS